MSAESNLPPNIENFVSIINKLEKKTRLNAAEKKKLCLCKLKIAMWACRSEGMEMSRYSLSQVLGGDTAEVFSKIEKEMLDINWENEEDRALNRKIAMKYQPGSGGKKSGGGGSGAGSGNIELFK